MLAFFPANFLRIFPAALVCATLSGSVSSAPRSPNVLYNPQATQNFFIIVTRFPPPPPHSTVIHVTERGGGGAQTNKSFKKKNRLSPLHPLENGAEIEELLKFHCQLFAKVSGIFLRSCLQLLRASERASKRAREGEEGKGRHRERDLGLERGAGQGPRRRQGRGREGSGTSSRDPKPGADGQESGWRR